MIQNLDLKLGWNCNHNCIHCVVSDKKAISEQLDFSLDNIKYFIDNNLNTEKITLTGGEPSIRRDIVDIVEYIHCRIPTCKISMQTNGTGLANIDLANKLNKHISSYLIAIHSYDKNIHDTICDCPGSWDDSIKAIVNINNYNINNKSNIEVCTQTVINKKNIPSLEYTFNFLLKLRVNYSTLTFPHANGNALKNFQNVVPRFSEIKNIVYRILSKGGQNVIASSFPPCYLNNFAFHIEGVLQEYQSFTTKVIELEKSSNSNFSVKNDFNNLIKSEFKKSSNCSKCIYNNKCLGVWKEYIDFYGDEDIIPVLGLSNEYC